MDRLEIQKNSVEERDVKDTDTVLSNGQYNDDIYRAILLKTEKLAAAVYLITDLMDTRENIRWELRSSSVGVIKDLYVLERSLLKNVSYIVSLLDIGLTGGVISEMNHSILKAEYSKLKGVIVKFQLTNGEGSSVLSSQFLGPNLDVLEKMVPGNKPALNLKGQDYLRDISNVSFIKKDRKEEAAKKTLTTKTGKTLRHNLIVKTMKDEEEYTIKDIINKVSLISSEVDCSDKTIQRDLLSLVASGVLIKKGERRWSRYSKINTPGN